MAIAERIPFVGRRIEPQDVTQRKSVKSLWGSAQHTANIRTARFYEVVERTLPEFPLDDHDLSVIRAKLTYNLSIGGLHPVFQDPENPSNHISRGVKKTYEEFIKKLRLNFDTKQVSLSGDKKRQDKYIGQAETVADIISDYYLYKTTIEDYKDQVASDVALHLNVMRLLRQGARIQLEYL